MNHSDLPTDALIESYFETDDMLHAGGRTAGSLNELADIMSELESRGVCPRELESPRWYADATDIRRGMC